MHFSKIHESLALGASQLYPASSMPLILFNAHPDKVVDTGCHIGVARPSCLLYLHIYTPIHIVTANSYGNSYITLYSMEAVAS